MPAITLCMGWAYIVVELQIEFRKGERNNCTHTCNAMCLARCSHRQKIRAWNAVHWESEKSPKLLIILWFHFLRVSALLFHAFSLTLKWSNGAFISHNDQMPFVLCVRACEWLTDNEERKTAQELGKINWKLKSLAWQTNKVKRHAEQDQDTEKTTQKEKEVAKKEEKNPPNLNKFVLYFLQCTPCIERDRERETKRFMMGSCVQN